ncbi:hypothetical protein [Bacillus sp. AK128]
MKIFKTEFMILNKKAIDEIDSHKAKIKGTILFLLLIISPKKNLALKKHLKSGPFKVFDRYEYKLKI